MLNERESSPGFSLLSSWNGVTGWLSWEVTSGRATVVDQSVSYTFWTGRGQLGDANAPSGQPRHCLQVSCSPKRRGRKGGGRRKPGLLANLSESNGRDPSAAGTQLHLHLSTRKPLQEAGDIFMCVHMHFYLCACKHMHTLLCQHFEAPPECSHVHVLACISLHLGDQIMCAELYA